MAAHEITVPLIVLAGLVDGINPCVISTLVFFASLLLVAGIRGRRLIAVGMGFCAGSYVTYLTLGLGLAHLLHAASCVAVVQRSVESLMMCVLMVLGCLSFRDAFLYAHTCDPKRVSLRLPGAMKLRVHAVVRRGASTRWLVAASVLLGCLTTLIESVCTGQVYVPALVTMIKTQPVAARVWLLLVLYNLCFITPLAAVFALMYAGVSIQRLMTWSRANVVISKCAMGCLFIAMATLLLIL